MLPTPAPETPTGTHVTVLLHEAVQQLLGNLHTHRARHYIDGTFGRGGHSRLVLGQLGSNDTLTVFDKDPAAIATAKTLTDARLRIVHEGFSHIAELPAQSADGLLLDLGVSSPQLDEAQRGFSFRFDAPLDMRMDTTRGPTVAQWLQTATVAHIAEVIHEYGEERFALPIAKAIDARRQSGQPVLTTAELAELVARAVKTREPGQNPATRTFQAFRIHINAELEELQQALLKPMGRLVVISFHSLEDRIVKQFIAKHSREVYDRRAPFAAAAPTLLNALGRFKPSDAEVAANPRARSAVMRVAERTATPVRAAA
jgi:16S rRNA (cytosine1402-N4)-methyltransferase